MKPVHMLDPIYRTYKSFCGIRDPRRWISVDSGLNSTNYCRTGLKPLKLRITCKRCLKKRKSHGT